MPSCPIHGFYFGQSCIPCASSKVLEAKTIAPQFDSDSPPGQLNRFFSDLVRISVQNNSLKQLAYTLVDSNKNVGFIKGDNLKGLNQRFSEFGEFSQPDPGHVHWYVQQMEALKVVLGLCTDNRIRFTEEEWEIFNRVMERPPPTCKTPPNPFNKGPNDRDDEGPGGFGGGGARVRPRTRLGF